MTEPIDYNNKVNVNVTLIYAYKKAFEQKYGKGKLSEFINDILSKEYTKIISSESKHNETKEPSI